MFVPRTRALTAPGAGLYLIADGGRANLRCPESVIYLGRSSGAKALSTFHMRLWKHCCKAIGACGGGYTGLSGEPRDTSNWAAYREKGFKGFAGWHFSLAVLAGRDMGTLASLAETAECAAMEEYKRQAGGLPACNDKAPRRVSGGLEIIFPWDPRSEQL
ncbi:hypothetical protein ASG87_04955 [Frateuria sp. Soil773]|nr:hypothetical protein ASG87_04955 [Frateuria sp. Soil773]